MRYNLGSIHCWLHVNMKQNHLPSHAATSHHLMRSFELWKIIHVLKYVMGWSPHNFVHQFYKVTKQNNNISTDGRDSIGSPPCCTSMIQYWFIWLNWSFSTLMVDVSMFNILHRGSNFLQHSVIIYCECLNYECWNEVLWDAPCLYT